MNKKIFPFKEKTEYFIESNKTFLDNQSKKEKKIYILGMWPYPSGDLHMGHVRNYTIVDITTRLFSLKNYEVFCPMGWDSFGLPAENAAIELNISPKTWTDKNIDNMKNQLHCLFFLYNWKKEMKTSGVSYYKWQQKLFIEMWKKGYIKKKLSYIDYDPVDCTTLAKEQITAEGRGWRSGALVEKRLLHQWFFKMSDFSEQLLEDISKLDGKWPNQITTMQRNWIGKNDGFGIKFKVIGENREIEIFTKSPYYLKNVEFIAVAPDSDYGIHLYENNKIANEFISKHPRNLHEKTGDFRGVYTTLNAINPLNNATLPIYVSNYVLGDYGTGIVMGVPSICDNDNKFAIFNKIDIKESIKINENYLETDQENKEHQKETQELLKNNITYKKTVYKLKDWCISRQRYWGCSIPIIYCENCGTLENKDLPVHLDDSREITLNKNVTCWKCGNKNAKPETDTMDTFVDSSWYQYRFPSGDNLDTIFDENTLVNFPKVNIYVGGPEHAVLHLLFARFFGKMLKNLGYIKEDEPFERLYTQGMICMQTYKTKNSKIFVNPINTYEENGKLLYKTPSGEIEEIIVGNFEKMSKSKKNTVDPQKMLNTYGVDALRLSVVSDTPADKDLQWNTDNLNGCWMFVNKIWNLSHKILEHKEENGTGDSLGEEIILNLFHKIIQNLENFHFNIGIANFRILVNYIEDNFNSLGNKLLRGKWIDFLSLLWTICPVVSSSVLKLFDVDINNLVLPYSRSKENSKIYELVVQKNGKKFLTLEANQEDTQEDILQKIGDKVPEYESIVFVKNKIINFVCKK